MREQIEVLNWISVVVTVMSKSCREVDDIGGPGKVARVMCNASCGRP